MSNTIHLKCGIEGCNDYYEYKLDLRLPKAIEARWIESLSDKEGSKTLLREIPNIGKSYEIEISSPIKLDLDENFWVLYMNPNGILNGIENEEDVESIRFCLCRSLQILKQQDKLVELRVEVVKMEEPHKLIDYQTDRDSVLLILNEFFLTKHYVNIENFKHYSLIEINVQSDLGWIYIINKKDNKYTIIAENKWGSHQCIWKSINLDLTESEANRYGLRRI